MKRITLAVAVVAACLPITAKSRHVGARPVLIYSMDNCPACEALAHTLSGSGIRLRVARTDEMSVSSFPTVLYSDGRRDSGSRIQNGLCELPTSVRVLKWIGD
ncbi:MAG: hypothetical protein ACR2IE_08240 [Candidatus Sumerlaeaceae bacterium]